MAKISDEIRRWCNFYCGKSINRYDCDNLSALADRIDSEMVELPKDADGMYIHVGDTVYLPDGHKAEVGLIDISRSKHGIAFWVGGKDFLHIPKNITHERHDSLERIADELDELVDGPGPADDVCEKLADLADRIRKLAVKEGKR